MFHAKVVNGWLLITFPSRPCGCGEPCPHSVFHTNVDQTANVCLSFTHDLLDVVSHVPTQYFMQTWIKQPMRALRFTHDLVDVVSHVPTQYFIQTWIKQPMRAIRFSHDLVDVVSHVPTQYFMQTCIKQPLCPHQLSISFKRGSNSQWVPYFSFTTLWMW